MSNLQCPATLLLVSPFPEHAIAELVSPLRERRVAHIWCGPDEADVADDLAASLNTAVTIRDELASAETGLIEQTLWEIVDEYRGETVLVVGPAKQWPGVVHHICGRRVDDDQGVIELRNDGEGWIP